MQNKNRLQLFEWSMSGLVGAIISMALARFESHWFYIAGIAILSMLVIKLFLAWKRLCEDNRHLVDREIAIAQRIGVLQDDLEQLRSLGDDINWDAWLQGEVAYLRGCGMLRKSVALRQVMSGAFRDQKRQIAINFLMGMIEEAKSGNLSD